MRKKIPPFGTPLAKLKKNGKTLNNSINLFLGKDAWEKGKWFAKSYPERTLIIPPMLCPKTFIWTVSDEDVLIFDTGYADADYIHDLVTELFMANAAIVRLVTHLDELIVFRVAKSIVFNQEKFHAPK